MTSAAVELDRRGLKALLSDKLPRYSKSGNYAAASTSTIPISTNNTAPPQTSTTDATLSPLSFSPPSLDMDLCSFHLRDELTLQSVVILPGLSDYCAMLCDGALEDNNVLPDLPPGHEYDPRWRVPNSRESAAVVSPGALQALCMPRERIAAGISAAILNQSTLHLSGLEIFDEVKEPWDNTDYIFWASDNNTEYPDYSSTAHLHIDRPAIPELQPFTNGLQAAADHALTPFLVYYLTDIDFLTDGVTKAIEYICSTKGKFEWERSHSQMNPHCIPSCKQRQAPPTEIPCVGRLAGPDSMIPAHIVEDIKSVDGPWRFNRTKSLPTAVNLAKARVLLRKVWTKLVASNGTFAVIEDGNRQIICMRHRNSQTMFLSKATYLSRNPCNKEQPSPMKVRIGINIAATLDVAWRGHLWREAARLKIDLPTKLLWKHLYADVTAERLEASLLAASQIIARWEEVPVLLELFQTPEYLQTEFPGAELVVAAQNQSQLMDEEAEDRTVPTPDLETTIEVDLSRELYRGASWSTARACAWLSSSESTECGIMLAYVVLGMNNGSQLCREYNFRLRIMEQTESKILPRVFGFFAEPTQGLFILLLEDIGMTIFQYVDYLNETRSRSQLALELTELEAGLNKTLIALHSTGHSHGILSPTDILVAMDNDKELRVLFQNLHEMSGDANEMMKAEDQRRMGNLVRACYGRVGLLASQ